MFWQNCSTEVKTACKFKLSIFVRALWLDKKKRNKNEQTQAQQHEESEWKMHLTGIPYAITFDFDERKVLLISLNISSGKVYNQVKMSYHHSTSGVVLVTDLEHWQKATEFVYYINNDGDGDGDGDDHDAENADDDDNRRLSR